MPRFQVGFPPQHLLLALLGDYWSGRSEPLPSAALVDLLAEFDVNPSGARAALSRLSIRGLARRDQGWAQHLLSSRRRVPAPAAVRPDPHSSLRQAEARLGRHVDDGGLHRSGGPAQGASDAARSTAVAWVLLRCTTDCGCRRMRPTRSSTSPWRSRRPLSCTVIRATELPSEHSVGGGVGMEPRRARSVVRGVHHAVSAGAAPSRQRQDRPDRGVGQPDPGQLSMVRLRRHRPRSARSTAAERVGRGLQRTTCSSLWSTDWPRRQPSGCARSSPNMTLTWANWLQLRSVRVALSDVNIFP